MLRIGGFAQAALAMAIIALAPSSEFTSIPKNLKKRPQTTNVKDSITGKCLI